MRDAQTPKRVHNSPNRAEEPDKRCRARGGGQEGQIILEFGDLDTRRAFHGTGNVVYAAQLGRKTLSHRSVFLRARDSNELLIARAKHLSTGLPFRSRLASCIDERFRRS